MLSGLRVRKSASQILPRLSPHTTSQPSTGISHSEDGSSSSYPSPRPSSRQPSDYSYLSSPEQLLPIESDDPDLRDFNNSLVALAAIFPDVQVEVFREMLSSFDEKSRLAVVTEALLKEKMRWVRGRYRVAAKDQPPQVDQDGSDKCLSQGFVPREERFRSEEYKKAVKNITYHEFKGLSRSTINAVLAEVNHSYALARPTLVQISSKSWRFSLSSLFLRRKPLSSLESENHPLVIWLSTGLGSIIPTLKPTGSAELDKELMESLILPLRQQMLTEQEYKDHKLAVKLNNHEAEEHQGLHDCECCFTAVAFEDLSACNGGGHFICFQCVRHAVNEAVFGQGWQRNIDLETGTLRCVAAMSDDCQGCVPQELVSRAFSDDKAGHEVLQKLDERLAEDNLLKTGLPLIRCPFCSYAEIDELYLPESLRPWRFKTVGLSSLYTIVLLILGVGMIPFFLPVFLVFSFIFLLASSQQTFGGFILGQLNNSVTRLRRKRLGLKFVCQNKYCQRNSCMACSKAWTDIHICHESSLVALRTQVELAMSHAIKRTCPRCNTSFVKSSGCNKLTCICGYQMCYVCRKDIGNGEGYRHFCEHFRPNGGRQCTECSKCDLYRCEDDEIVVKKAKEEAERRWMEKEGTDLGADEVKRALEENGKIDSEAQWWESRWCQWNLPTWLQVFDALVEGVIE